MGGLRLTGVVQGLAEVVQGGGLAPQVVDLAEGGNGLPMMLETPKTEGRRPQSIDVDPLDANNLKTLRGLIARRLAS